MTGFPLCNRYGRRRRRWIPGGIKTNRFGYSGAIHTMGSATFFNFSRSSSISTREFSVVDGNDDKVCAAKGRVSTALRLRFVLGVVRRRSPSAAMLPPCARRDRHHLASAGRS